MSVFSTFTCSIHRHEKRPYYPFGNGYACQGCWYVSVVCGAMLPSCLIDCFTLESHLSSTNFKGFPIVSSDGSLTLVGYIDRSEIRYVLGKLPMLKAPYDYSILFVERARKNRGRLANIPCLFTARYQEPDDIDLAPEVHEDDEPEEYFAPTTAGEGINFWPWVNKV